MHYGIGTIAMIGGGMTIIKSDHTTKKHYFFAKEIEDELIKKIMNGIIATGGLIPIALGFGT